MELAEAKQHDLLIYPEDIENALTAAETKMPHLEAACERLRNRAEAVLRLILDER